MPPPCLWVQRGDAKAKLAVTDAGSPAIRIYDMRSGSNDPLDVLSIHSQPVTALAFNEPHNTVISADSRGILEYWSADTYQQPEHGVVAFSLKLDTDLYALAKAKTSAHWLDVAVDGSKFVAVAADHKIRVFRFATGKLSRVYDEGPEAVAELQRQGAEAFRLEPIDFGRRVAAEKELQADPEAPGCNAVFDESGNFLLFPTLLGIKVRGRSVGAGARPQCMWPACWVGCWQCLPACLPACLHSTSDGEAAGKVCLPGHMPGRCSPLVATQSLLPL